MHQWRLDQFLLQVHGYSAGTDIWNFIPTPIWKKRLRFVFEIPGWCPQRKGEPWAPKRSTIYSFYFMKSVVGFLTLLNRNCRMVKRGLWNASRSISQRSTIFFPLFSKDSPIWPPNKKALNGPIIAERNVITKSWSLGLPDTTPTRPPGVHPPKTCREVTSFSSTTCRFATGPKDLVFTLGSKIFLFHIIWPLVFTQLGSPIIFQNWISSHLEQRGWVPRGLNFYFQIQGLGGLWFNFVNGCWIL